MKLKVDISVRERMLSLGIWRSSLLFFLISFVGWCFEKVARYIVYNSVTDRGFLTMPLCPIYGFSILMIYFLIGSPKSPIIGVEYETDGRWERVFSFIINFLIYFIFAAAVTSAVELVTGMFFKEVMGVTLWNYQDRFMNLWGYICLGYSMLWGGLISLFMLFCWESICRAVRKIRIGTVRVLGALCLTLMMSDFIFNLIYLFKVGSHFNFL